MPAARSLRTGSAAQPPSKRGFAKRALAFAKRALPRKAPPGFPLLWVACFAAALLMIVTGGFNTGRLPLGPRIAFWLLLMGWNALKWQLLFAWGVRKDSDWPRISLLGTIPLNLPLPLEIWACAWLVGTPMQPIPHEIWGRAAAISVVIFTVCSVVAWLVLRRMRPVRAETGLLARARIAACDLAAIEAEDHYCRVHRRDGRSELLHYRFGDALEEVARLDGLQVHRGAWVAADAVQGATREGRKWRLLLAGGGSVPVSATYAAEARARGWLRNPAKP
ncbi:LytTR family DNA-binding domain-containing protein [Sphingomonas sp. HITSZ_GF]|uniref:LytTR family DNA-binding domain-containing protein n=1 Tax=Sphingomonas sp. HITSZ_GF TaxID=3037247 RepID=UPI00240D21FF|nr:LytTR family DNA-binding domain-containing protein [Sphingomonas sp. HITSZ_GF]MDG2535625.1 LytTR family DNA-binding domain-containing protein [Sphingomonas sp. HITSZ_GF]